MNAEIKVNKRNTFLSLAWCVSDIDQGAIVHQRGTKFTHPLRFWSNFAQMFLLIRNKSEQNLTLSGSWDIGFWNLGNFRAFFSEICHFELSISNEIVITWVLYDQSSWKLAPLYFFGKIKNHIKNWPWALETGLTLN